MQRQKSCASSADVVEEVKVMKGIVAATSEGNGYSSHCMRVSENDNGYGNGCGDEYWQWR